MFSLIYGSVNNRQAGDLRGHRAHYDVILMNKNVLSSESSHVEFILGTIFSNT